MANARECKTYIKSIQSHMSCPIKQWNELNKLLIHLPERTDRLDDFKNELTYLPCNNLIITQGIKHSQSYKGIAQAHLNCISIAKGNEWPRVLIMEDDVVFQGGEKPAPHLYKCLEIIPEDWDILLGGVYQAKELNNYNEFWDKVGEFCGLHFYIVNAKAYDKILQYDFIHHIDRWMNQKNRLNCYVINKFIATQRSGYSDNVKEKVDYKSKLKKFTL